MRLLACISHHGYGHLAQTAPVLNQLRALRPDVSLVVRSALPRDRLAARIAAPFEHLTDAVDCGFIMQDAIRIDAPASLAAYRALHRDWPRRVGEEAERLANGDIRAVFSNVAYLPLAAAEQAGLPAVAMCSLNWADIFAHYFAHSNAEHPGQDPDIPNWLAQMQAAYRSATAFLRPTPAMAMTDLANAREIPPVASLGRPQADALRTRLKVTRAQRLVLIGMGGIGYRPPVEDWPTRSDLLWLVPDEWGVSRPDMLPFSATGMTFIDLLASADALITKPGYGSFTEAAAHGLPVLYLPRPDWPESPVLEDWLHMQTRAARVEESDLFKGDVVERLRALWAQPANSPPAADGARAAAEFLSELLG